MTRSHYGRSPDDWASLATQSGATRAALPAQRYLRSEVTEPANAERQTASAIGKYALQLSSWLKIEAGKNRKQRRRLKQLHLDLKEVGFEGAYDRVAAFARKWKVDHKLIGSIQLANEH